MGKRSVGDRAEGHAGNGRRGGKGAGRCESRGEGSGDGGGEGSRGEGKAWVASVPMSRALLLDGCILGQRIHSFAIHARGRDLFFSTPTAEEADGVTAEEARASA